MKSEQLGHAKHGVCEILEAIEKLHAEDAEITIKLSADSIPLYEINVRGFLI